MAKIEWRDEFSVGNVVIDREHKNLIEQINGLYELLFHSTDSLKIESLLDDIHANISAHFAFEELLMSEAAFAEYEEHRKDHETLLDQINDMVFSFSEDPETGRQLLKDKMSNWFANHFVTFDARLHNQLAPETG